MDPVIGAAGLTALATLFSGVMNQNAAKEQAKEAERLALEREKRERLAQAQRDQINIVQRMGEGEQGALNQLMGVLARTAR